MGLLDSLIPSVYGIIQGIGQKSKAKEAARKAQENFDKGLGFANQGLDLAKGNYDFARNLYGGRMAGAQGMEQNIYGSQANTMASLNRNSTSASQQLALAGAVQGNTNDAFGNLASLEAQDKQRRYADVAAASQGLQYQQGNMENLWNQQSQQAQQSANELGNAGAQNIFNGIKGIANAGSQGMSDALSMFSGGMMGGGQSGSSFPGLSMPQNIYQQPQYGNAPQFNMTLPGLIPRKSIFG